MPELIYEVQIGSKDGALLHYWSTSPPSAPRTGRATRRCTQLASNFLSRVSVATHAPPRMMLLMARGQSSFDLLFLP